MADSDPDRDLDRDDAEELVPEAALEYMNRLAETHEPFTPEHRDALMRRLRGPPEEVREYIDNVEALDLRWSEKRTREVRSALEHAASGGSSEAPQSPADPRPGGEPYYIASDCPKCGVALELADELDDQKPVWHDEWRCPECGDLHADWPPAERQRLLDLADDDAEYTPLEDSGEGESSGEGED